MTESVNAVRLEPPRPHDAAGGAQGGADAPARADGPA